MHLACGAMKLSSAPIGPRPFILCPDIQFQELLILSKLPPFRMVSARLLSLSPLVLHFISIFYLPAPLFTPSKGFLLLCPPCPACTLTYTPFPPFHLCPNNKLCYFVCVVGIWIRDQEVSDLKSQGIYLNFIVTVRTV